MKAVCSFLFSVTLLLRSIYCKEEEQSRAGGILHLKFGCYNNPGHVSENGKYCDVFPSRACDPYFIFCVSDKISSSGLNNCGLYKRTTQFFNDLNQICEGSVQTKSEILNKPVEIAIHGPVPETFRLAVVIKDYDSHTSGHNPIATFVSNISFTPIPNDGSIQFLKLSMKRTVKEPKNGQVSLTMFAAVQCNKFYYGKHCLDRCEPDPVKYDCDEDGKRICKIGWLGRNCEDIDYCVMETCASYAECRIKSDGSGKECFCNGHVGPECDVDTDHCQSQPCLNGGTCTLSGLLNETFECECTKLWSGSSCENRIDQCQSKPCRNGATCFMSSFGEISCVCGPRFTGKWCEEVVNITVSFKGNDGGSKIYKRTQTLSFDNPILIGAVAGVAAVVLFALLLVVLLVRKRKAQKKERNNGMFELAPTGIEPHANKLYEDVDGYQVPSRYAHMPVTDTENVYCSPYDYPEDPRTSGATSSTYVPSDMSSLLRNSAGSQPSDTIDYRPPLPDRRASEEKPRPIKYVRPK